LRIVRLRIGDHEIPEWYAQKGEDEYGFASGIFTMGAGGQVFASVQEKPPTMKDLSKESSKALAQTRLNKKSHEIEVFHPRPDIKAWNPGICEITVSCAQHEDALMCAVVTNELRYHFASHFRSPTVYPIPLHLASLLNHYMLPLSKPLRDARTGPDEEE
jgi:RNaseH domain of pPIWI_RE